MKTNNFGAFQKVTFEKLSFSWATVSKKLFRLFLDVAQNDIFRQIGSHFSSVGERERERERGGGERKTSSQCDQKKNRQMYRKIIDFDSFTKIA